MGKIVKFCDSCDEGFAEKFGFCPNCGQTLQTFEMSQIVPGDPVVQQSAVAPVSAPAVSEVIEPFVAPIAQAAVPSREPVSAPIIAEPVIAQPVETPVLKAPVQKAAATVAPFVQKTAVDIDRKPVVSKPTTNTYAGDGGFHVTVIEEKNVGQRRILLVGAFGFILFSLMTGLVYNLFSKDLGVGSINDDIFNAVIVDDVPVTVEEAKQKKDKDGGGGGGGGRDEKEETTQGDLADQAKNPTRPPDAKVFRSDNFELKTPPPQTEGDRKFDKKFDRWGDPNGRFASFSNGTGTGGGQGSGTGTGQGSGRGTGAGSGNGSGSGGGLGTGNGNGLGPGGGDDGPPPPKVVAGVSQGLKILSKPKAAYTDAARTNNIQGVVLLRVTFLASGQVGSISTVKGLSGGLTENAIAAARSIRFEPAKVNGVAQAVTKTMEFSFSIY